MTETRRRRDPAVDPDRLARWEEERDFLLRSIEDLDREFAAGDVDQRDYDELREGYVSRAAVTLHEIGHAEEGLAELKASPRGARRRLAWVGGVVVFAAVAGVLLARSSGFRADGNSLTGTGVMPGERLTQCQGQLKKDPLAAVTCFGSLLKSTPDDVEVLTFSGWAKVLSGDLDGGSATLDRALALDPSSPNAHVFKAAADKQRGDFAAAQAQLDALYALNPPAIVLDTLRGMHLDSEVAVGLLPASTQACWAKAEPAINDAVALESIDPAKMSDADKEHRVQVATALAGSLQCLDGVVAKGVDVAALEMRAVGLLALAHVIGGDDGELAVRRARSSADAAVAAAPQDATTHLVRGTVAMLQGDLDTAEADLAAARKGGPVSPLFRALVTVDSLDSALSQVKAASTPSTTTLPGDGG